MWCARWIFSRSGIVYTGEVPLSSSVTTLLHNQFSPFFFSLKRVDKKEEAKEEGGRRENRKRRHTFRRFTGLYIDAFPVLALFKRDLVDHLGSRFGCSHDTQLGRDFTQENTGDGEGGIGDGSEIVSALL